MKVKIINTSTHGLPEYKTKEAAGMDLSAYIEKPIILEPLERALVPTGIFIELPRGYEAQIRPRSGWALKYGITCLNSPGTIDSDYRGEIGVILANVSNMKFEINNGDRIAQMVIAKYKKIKWEIVETLSDTIRSNNGFGSTGLTK